jgi:hypothetical protein
MKTIQGVFAAVAVSFACGLFFSSNSEVAAFDPDPCPKWQCIEIKSWWTPAGGVVLAVDATTLMPTKDGFTNTFAVGPSMLDAPTAPVLPMIKWRTYPFCNPTCGKDPAGVWQARQEVTPAGMLINTSAAKFQNACTAINNNKLPGPTLEPTNDNPNSEVPPIEANPTPGG